MATDNRFKRALQEEEEERERVRRAGREFDPRGATREAARAGYAQFEEDLGERLETLRGRQVGSGRLRTGFGSQDQDRVVEAGLEDLNRQLASNALEESSLRLRNLEGRRRSNRYLDLLTSERQREEREEEERAGGIGALIGGGAGFLLGGPAGAAAGSAIGGGAGRAIF